MENVTQRQHNQGLSFQNQEGFLNFYKGQGASHIPLSCVPVSMAEYALISLNMPKYPWKCLKKLF